MKKFDVTLTAHYEKTLSVYADSPNKQRQRPKLSSLTPTSSTFPMKILSAAKPPLTNAMRTVLKKSKMMTRTNVQTVSAAARYAVTVCMLASAEDVSYQALNLDNQIRLSGDAPDTPSKRKEF